MKIRILFLFSIVFYSLTTFADQGMVTITSPESGATVMSNDKIELMYKALPGDNGDHVHLYLDSKRIDVIHSLMGKAEVGMLDAGKHHICLTLNTKAHVPTGAEACIDVMAK